MIKNNLIFILVVLVFSCTEKESTSDTKHIGGTVQIALNSVIDDILPLTTNEINADQIHRYMLSPSFVVFDEDGEAQPDLADGWQISSDNQSVLFILNPKMTWNNGRSVTTKDVHFTFNLINSEHIESLYKERTKVINDLQIIDSLTCRFNFIKPVSDPLYFTNFAILPAELDSFQSDLSKFTKQYLKNFIGCGSYILKSFTTDSLVLQRNNYYPNNYLFLDKIVFIFVQTNDQLIQFIEDRKIDLVANLPLEIAAHKEYLEYYKILTYPERGYTFIGWNLQNPLLKEKQIRLALSAAIDKQTLVDGILGGYSNIVNSPAYGKNDISENDIPKWSYNPALADSLFNSLGWITSDTDGIRRKYGKKLSFILKVNKENKERIDCAVNIKANLRSVGVDLQLEFVSWKQIFMSIRLKNCDAIMLTWTDGDHYDPSNLFHSSAIDNGLNFMSYSNAKADSLIEGALQAWDKKQRKYFWNKFQKLIAEDIPCTFLFSQSILVGSNNNLKNVAPDKRGYLVNVKEWWLETKSKILQ
ncbi:ABC transporter substrate-binding protein [Calditrichota bacterium]